MSDKTNNTRIINPITEMEEVVLAFEPHDLWGHLGSERVRLASLTLNCAPSDTEEIEEIKSRVKELLEDFPTLTAIWTHTREGIFVSFLAEAPRAYRIEVPGEGWGPATEKSRWITRIPLYTHVMWVRGVRWVGDNIHDQTTVWYSEGHDPIQITTEGWIAPLKGGQAFARLQLK